MDVVEDVDAIESASFKDPELEEADWPQEYGRSSSRCPVSVLFSETWL